MSDIGLSFAIDQLCAIRSLSLGDDGGVFDNVSTTNDVPESVVPCSFLLDDDSETEMDVPGVLRRLADFIEKNSTPVSMNIVSANNIYNNSKSNISDNSNRSRAASDDSITLGNAKHNQGTPKGTRTGDGKSEREEGQREQERSSNAGNGRLSRSSILLSNVPERVLQRIARHLPTLSRLVLSGHITRRIRAILDPPSIAWTDIDLSRLGPNLTDTFLNSSFRTPHRLSSAEKLNMWGCTAVSSECLAMAIADCRSVRDVNLGRCEISRDVAVAMSRHCSELTSVNLWNCDGVGDEELAVLGRLRMLDSLDVGHCSRVSDDGLVRFAEERASRNSVPMKMLRLTWCFRVTDAGLLAVVQPSVPKVSTTMQMSKPFSSSSFSSCPNFELRKLPPMKSGADANLSSHAYPNHSNHSNHSNHNRNHINNRDNIHSDVIEMAGLESLDIVGLAHVTDVALCEIAQRAGSTLQILRAKGCTSLTDRTLFEIACHCRENLSCIDISLCKSMTTDGVRELTMACDSLKELTLEGCHDVGAGALALASARENSDLRSLSVAFCSQMDEESICDLLYRCPNLERLDLRWIVNTTGATLNALNAACPKLKDLDIRWCDRLKDAEIAWAMKKKEWNIKHCRASAVGPES